MDNWCGNLTVSIQMRPPPLTRENRRHWQASVRFLSTGFSFSPMVSYTENKISRGVAARERKLKLSCSSYNIDIDKLCTHIPYKHIFFSKLKTILSIILISLKFIQFFHSFETFQKCTYVILSLVK